MSAYHETTLSPHDARNLERIAQALESIAESQAALAEASYLSELIEPEPVKMMQAPHQTAAPAKGCRPCREGDHFGCWQDEGEEANRGAFDLLDFTPVYECECAEEDHPS